MSIEIWLSGFFFLFIIITNFASGFFGYKTFGDVDPDAQLRKINKNPSTFKFSVAIILLEHLGIIALAVSLFIAFSPYNLMLGIVWATFRIAEALIQIYDKKNYWKLFNLAKQYSDANGTEKDRFIDLCSNILKTKASRFSFAQILFSIGTLAYSILFAVYGIVPIIIGWFGVVASILYGGGNIIFRIKSDFKILWNIGGLLILLFEVVLGGWLLFFS